MKISANTLKRLACLAEGYDQVASYAMASKKKTALKDHQSAAGRVCRFCGKGMPHVSFRAKAHAVPEFLGNRSIFSLNECKTCNATLSAEYEDHLAKWFGPFRAIAQMPGKKGVPTYKSKDGRVRISMGEDGPCYEIMGLELAEQLDKGGPLDFTIPAEMTTQPFVPLRAAKAFVKAACSIAPLQLLPSCQLAIGWLNCHEDISCSSFPVTWSYTPGPNPFGSGHVQLYQAKPDKKLPLLFVMTAANLCFQTIVPFSDGNSDGVQPGSKTYEVPFFPPPVSWEHEEKHGKTKTHHENWADNVQTIKTWDVPIHADQIRRVK